MLRAATHILNFRANIVSLAPGFSPVEEVERPSSRISALKNGANENQKLS